MSTGSDDGDELSDRINAMKAKHTARNNRQTTPEAASGWAKGSRMAVELVAGIIVGGFIGYMLDMWLNTSPWGFVVCLMFGFAAGVTNVVRAAQSMNAANANKADDAS